MQKNPFLLLLLIMIPLYCVVEPTLENMEMDKDPDSPANYESKRNNEMKILSLGDIVKCGKQSVQSEKKQDKPAADSPLELRLHQKLAKEFNFSSSALDDKSAVQKRDRQKRYPRSVLKPMRRWVFNSPRTRRKIYQTERPGRGTDIKVQYSETPNEFVANLTVTGEDEKSTSLEEKLVQKIMPGLVRVLASEINSRHTPAHQVFPQDIGESNLGEATVPVINPGGECDSYDAVTRTCWYNRAIGDSLTLTLKLEEKIHSNLFVVWQRHFKLFHKNDTIAMDIDHDTPPWNMVVGSAGKELRLSPLTEIDFDYNSFTARVIRSISKDDRRMNQFVAEITFRINIIPFDLGHVYPGEELTLNVESYVMLPPSSLNFEWRAEKTVDNEDLPSNMKISHSGRIVSIKELRKDQEGILACNIYSMKGVFVTRRRFLIKELSFKSDIVEETLTTMLPIRAITSEEEPKLHTKRKKKREAVLDKEYPEEDKTIAADEDSGLEVGEVEDEEQQNTEFDIEQLTEVPEIIEVPVTIFSVEETEVETIAPTSTEKVTTTTVDSLTAVEIRESKLVSSCLSDVHCSSHANCELNSSESPGYCRCKTGFHGNGIFCWETPGYIPS